jgi:histidinol-phosphatase (PHP family)
MRRVDHPPDYHTHTRFSCDSNASMEATCRAALACAMAEIAITDHADFEPLDPCCRYLRAEPYWEALSRCRDVFAGLLTIRAGLECGESHIYRQEVQALVAAHEYDVVLGSLHWVGSRPTFSGSFFDGLAIDEGLELYLDELARLAAAGEYDVLAHADIIRRAAFQRFGVAELDLRRHEERMRRVLRTVAERGKGIEVNTSYLRKGLGPPGPSPQVLTWFRQEGGRFVTLGSDGHRPAEVGAGFAQALGMVREAGFADLATFERRTAAVCSGRDWGVVTRSPGRRRGIIRKRANGTDLEGPF